MWCSLSTPEYLYLVYHSINPVKGGGLKIMFKTVKLKQRFPFSFLHFHKWKWKSCGLTLRKRFSFSLLLVCLILALTHFQWCALALGTSTTPPPSPLKVILSSYVLLIELFPHSTELLSLAKWVPKTTWKVVSGPFYRLIVDVFSNRQLPRHVPKITHTLYIYWQGCLLQVPS